MSEEGAATGISPAEDLMIGETPALLCNKFYVTANPYGTKITFAEGFRVGGEQTFQSRCAIYLVPNDVRELYKLLEPIVQSMQAIPTNAGKSTKDG